MRDAFLDFVQNNENLVFVLLVIISTIFLIYIIHKVIKITLLNKKKASQVKKIVRLEHPILVIIAIMGFQAIISAYLQTYPRIYNDLNNTLVSVSIIIVAYVLGILGGYFLENWSKNLKKLRNDETHEGIVPLLKSVIQILLGFLALIFILQTWRISVGALLTSLGIAGVIIGFAFRDTLTNVFGGISLILDDTFRKGDLIEINDGELGFVLETSLRSTKLKNFDSEEVYIPNSLLANIKIKNYAQPTSIVRVKIKMPVAIGTDISKVEKVVMKLLENRPDILDFPPPKFYFLRVHEYFVEIAVAFFIPDFNDLVFMRSKLSREIYDALLKNKIEIPYPARKIYQDASKKSRGKKRA